MAMAIAPKLAMFLIAAPSLLVGGGAMVGVVLFPVGVKVPVPAIVVVGYGTSEVVVGYGTSEVVVGYGTSGVGVVSGGAVVVSAGAEVVGAIVSPGGVVWMVTPEDAQSLYAATMIAVGMRD